MEIRTVKRVRDRIVPASELAAQIARFARDV